MLSEEERRARESARLKDRRVLIVGNLLNGLPEWKIAEAYRCDVAEVNAVFRHAMNKLKNYLFRLRKPPIICDTIAEAKLSRAIIMGILPKLNLDSEPVFSRIIHETINGYNYKDAMHELRRPR